MFYILHNRIFSLKVNNLLKATEIKNTKSQIQPEKL